jgi:hypothetical protein
MKNDKLASNVNIFKKRFYLCQLASQSVSKFCVAMFCSDSLDTAWSALNCSKICLNLVSLTTCSNCPNTNDNSPH